MGSLVVDAGKGCCGSASPSPYENLPLFPPDMHMQQQLKVDSSAPVGNVFKNLDLIDRRLGTLGLALRYIRY